MTKDPSPARSDTSSLPDLEDTTTTAQSKTTKQNPNTETEMEGEGEGQEDTEKDTEQTRNEKKARKSLSKLGLKAVEGITRVVIRKTKNVSLHRLKEW